MDPRRERLEKALTASGAPFIEEVDRIVQEMVEYKNPLRQNLPRKPGSGDGYHLYRRTASTSGCAFVVDTQDFGSYEATGAYGKVSFPYRILGGQAKVTTLAQAQGRTFADLFEQELESKTREFKNCEEKYIIQGDSTVTGQWDGLAKLIPAAQTLWAHDTNYVGNLTLNKMDQSIDQCAFEPDLIITSKAGRRALNSLLVANQRFVDRTEIQGGFRVMTYNDIPVLASTNVPNTLRYDESGKRIISWTGGTSTAFFFVDTEYFFMGILKELGVVPLAITSSQFEAFDMYAFETTVMLNYLACSMLLGVVPK